jgi:hypothetical protein
MPKPVTYAVQVNLPEKFPDDIQPHVHVFDTHGKFITSASVPADGNVKMELPDALIGAAIRILVAPLDQKTAKLRDLRRANAVERTIPFDPEDRLVIDIPELTIVDWVLCICTIRGRVVKAVPQPTGTSVDYPVCNARVHICEVDKIPRLVYRIPDDYIVRLRDELLIEPPFPPDPIGPVIRKRIPDLPEPPEPGPGPIRSSHISSTPPSKLRPFARSAEMPEATMSETRVAASTMKAAASTEMTKLARAGSTVEIREALIELAIIYPWWCWFSWLDRFWRWEIDCLWEVSTDENGEFTITVIYPCEDKPDIYIWVEQFIAGSWKTIYARGPRCDTHWNYECGTDITIHVTHPDAIACMPPPEVTVPSDITTWVLPMAVGHLEIAGQGSHPGELGWLKSDGTASYSYSVVPDNVDPVTDAPMGGYLRFKMLHSLDLPKTGMTRYSWSYRPKPSPDPTIPGGWTKMDETVTRRYQTSGPGGFPRFPVYTLGPDSDELFEFRPHTPPAGVWPVSGFWEDLWSAKLNTNAMDPGLYQVRVTVHDGAGAVVPPSAGTFQFVVTDTRVAGETYDTRAATGAELIDDGFVFDVLIDNARCIAVLHPPQTGSGAIADPCGFLRYADKLTTDVTFSFEASHIRDHGWFTLEMVRGLTGLPQLEVMDGGLVGALSVPVDSNSDPLSTWGPGFYTGDGNGNFSGTFKAQRFLESCDNGAFAFDLHARAKAHNGIRRLSEYDDYALMGFALAEEVATP